MRRRLHRRAWRLTKLSRFLRRQGLIEDAAFFKTQPSFTDSAWALRVAGLDRLLTPVEWARVIYHLCKHRGFHWVSKAEEKKAEGDEKSESGRVKKALRGTEKLMLEKGYRTAAEMLLAISPDAQRNKAGEYTNALSRVLLAKELTDLFAAQRGFGSAHASVEIENEILGNGDRKTGFFWAQKPALSKTKMLEMLGKCTFEKLEYRAPKASFTAERHVWLTRLNNLRISVAGGIAPLNEAQRTAALLLPYQAGEKFTYANLKNALIKKGLLSKDAKFAGMAYPSDQQKEETKAKSPEDQILVKFVGWHDLRLGLNKAGLESEWLQISTAALEGKPEQLDQIAWVLSVCKDDAEIEAELRKLNLQGGEKLVQALLALSFDKFHALSLKALRLIVPHMETGLRYDEAVALIPEYGHHSQLHVVGAGEHKYLPSFYSGRDETGRLIFNEDMDVPRNPVVLRALNQARKVVNALIKEYGSPHSVHIELARDLSRPLKERQEIKKEQDQYRDRNEIEREKFNGVFKRDPKGAEFEKFRLYNEQDCKCAYSGEVLDLNLLLEQGYVEVDHALPYSRSFDDSKSNKVLTLTRENRNKGNQTPYEYLDGANNSARWHQFSVTVENNKKYRLAKRSRLLRKNFGLDEAKEFRDRNLNDTRYICKFFKNYVERYLQLAEGSESKRCVVVSGQLTSLLRARWGFNKVRAESDRHHALDAVVVAACSHGMVNRMTDYSKRKELEQVRGEFIDSETGEIIDRAMLMQLEAHFPKPWPHFHAEVEVRLKVDDPEQLRAHLQALGTYSAEELERVKPLFVSRAPQRRNSGAAHKETVYAKPKLGHELMVKVKTAANKQKAAGNEKRRASPEEKDGLAIQTMNVMATDQQGKYKLTLEKLENLVDMRRNMRMYTALQQWIEGREQRDNDASVLEKAITKEKRDPTEVEKSKLNEYRALPKKPLVSDPVEGPYSGPLIRSVKLNIGKTSGFEVRNGKVENETMLRVDVFVKNNRFHLIPLYVRHKPLALQELPMRAIVAAKDERDWTLVDETFEFLFSLHPNDLIRVQRQGEFPIFGYYRSTHSGTAAVSIALHDRAIRGERTTSLAFLEKNKDPDKKPPSDKLGLIEGIGVKTALSIEKFEVDVLGYIYPARRETRHGLA
jgi:CRISPR-associated endonuclease Csn1